MKRTEKWNKIMTGVSQEHIDEAFDFIAKKAKPDDNGDISADNMLIIEQTEKKLPIMRYIGTAAAAFAFITAVGAAVMLINNAPLPTSSLSSDGGTFTSSYESSVVPTTSYTEPAQSGAFIDGIYANTLLGYTKGENRMALMANGKNIYIADLDVGTVAAKLNCLDYGENLAYFAQPSDVMTEGNIGVEWMRPQITENRIIFTRRSYIGDQQLKDYLFFDYDLNLIKTVPSKFDTDCYFLDDENKYIEVYTDVDGTSINYVDVPANDAQTVYKNSLLVDVFGAEQFDGRIFVIAALREKYDHIVISIDGSKLSYSVYEFNGTVSIENRCPVNMIGDSCLLFFQSENYSNCMLTYNAVAGDYIELPIEESSEIQNAVLSKDGKKIVTVEPGKTADAPTTLRVYNSEVSQLICTREISIERAAINSVICGSDAIYVMQGNSRTKIEVPELMS